MDTETNSETTVGDFEIELPNGETLAEDDSLVHKRHGTLVVENIRNLGDRKKAEMFDPASEQSRKVTLEGDEIREQWGEEVAQDPLAVREVEL